ncbi:hypothetical protein T09_8667 [Trichinella sp. T9]|nr:hypothetical protein T09_8667 [Trichinella sp. T9]
MHRKADFVASTQHNRCLTSSVNSATSLNLVSKSLSSLFTFRDLFFIFIWNPLFDKWFLNTNNN